jgi:hypothetical protein
VVLRMTGHPRPFRVALTGASGFIGGSLAESLRARDHSVHPLFRRAPAPGSAEIGWHPSRGEIDAAALEGLDAVVNLAGESIAGGRWTPARKQAILDSRIRSTDVLCCALAGLAAPPRVLVSASAVGYYGDRGDEMLTEASPPGGGFLAELCQAWEAATDPAREAGIRVVTLRLGVVLSPRGGMLREILPLFRLGLGGSLGNGRQYLSWIALEDVLEVIRTAMVTEDLSGPVNAVAPNPVTNAEFTRTLGRLLHRPTFLRVPGFALRLLLGEMGQAVFLDSARALPARLQAAGFGFRCPDLGLLRLQNAG